MCLDSRPNAKPKTVRRNAMTTQQTFDEMTKYMGLLDRLFEKEETNKDTRKRVYISFAIEDVEYRNYLVD